MCTNLDQQFRTLFAVIKNDIQEINNGKGIKTGLDKARSERLLNNLQNLDHFMNIYNEHCHLILSNLDNFISDFLQSDIDGELVDDQQETKKELESDSLPMPEIIQAPIEVKESTVKTMSHKINIFEKQIEPSRKQGTTSLRNKKFRDLVKEVLSEGYKLVRVKGGHHQYKNAKRNSTVTIPKNKIVSRGVVKSVQREVHSSTSEKKEEPDSKVQSAKKKGKCKNKRK